MMIRAVGIGFALVTGCVADQASTLSRNKKSLLKNRSGSNKDGDSADATAVNAKSSVAKLHATRMEITTNLAASRAEGLRRVAELNTHTNEDAIRAMKKIVADTEKYKNEAEAHYMATQATLGEIKAIPDTEAAVVVDAQVALLQEKMVLLDEHMAVVPEAFIVGAKSLSKRQKDMIHDYAQQQREADMMAKIHERKAVNADVASLNMQDKANAVLAAAHHIDAHGDSVKAMDLYARAADALAESRAESDTVMDEQGKVAKIGRTIPVLEGHIAAIGAQ